VRGLLDLAYRGELRAAWLAEDKAKVLPALEDYNVLGEDGKRIAFAIVDAVILPNMVLNDELTAAARQNAMDAVYEVVYEPGQTIVNRGEILTAGQRTLLLENGMLVKPGIFYDPARNLATTLLVGFLSFLYVGYLFFFQIGIVRNARYFILVMSQMLLVLVFSMLANYFSVYLIPISFITMSLCTVFNPRIALQASVFALLFLLSIMKLDIDSVMYLLVSAMMGIVYMRKINSRMNIIKAGLVVCVGNILMIIAIAALRNNLGSQIISNAIYAVGSGVISSIATIGVVMVWESIFNIATPFKLLELSAPGEPLMQKLIVKAPGTYHHSLIVSNMAEMAAEDVNANALLARVGAYYHDIGKADKAAYFRENQASGQNPHDHISPDVSAKIIKNHVRDGEFLGQKQHLPPEVIEFIYSHHGTSEITYFKFEAEKAGYDGDEDFRYHGQLPESKETSIVMLADSIEAAVRSMDYQDPDSILEMIERIVHKKVREGQLARSRLSFAELETIKKSFQTVLVGVYHGRVKYPSQPDPEE
jgi:putative nucleotidyltransferase with HDIG domain